MLPHRYRLHTRLEAAVMFCASPPQASWTACSIQVLCPLSPPTHLLNWSSPVTLSWVTEVLMLGRRSVLHGAQLAWASLLLVSSVLTDSLPLLSNALRKKVPIIKHKANYNGQVASSAVFKILCLTYSISWYIDIMRYPSVWFKLLSTLKISNFPPIILFQETLSNMLARSHNWCSHLEAWVYIYFRFKCWLLFQFVFCIALTAFM